MIVRQALVHGANQLAPLHADAVEAWVNVCWQTLPGGTRRRPTADGTGVVGDVVRPR